MDSVRAPILEPRGAVKYQPELGRLLNLLDRRLLCTLDVQLLLARGGFIVDGTEHVMKVSSLTGSRFDSDSVGISR